MTTLGPKIDPGWPRRRLALEPAPPEPGELPLLEQRRHRRVALPARCWMVDDARTIYLRIHDLSSGGVSVRAPVPFPARATVEVHLELPGGATVRARGEVVWVRPDGGDARGPRMGARFLQILEGEAELARALGNA